MRLVNEYSPVLRVLGLVLGLVLDRQGHAERESLLSPLDVPAQLIPAVIGGDWAGLDVSSLALHQGQHAVAEAVVMELRVGGQHRARLVDRLLKSCSHLI